MILALSRFRVKNGLAADVRAAFVGRPRQVERAPGFQGLEVFTDRRDPAAFLLLTRWADVAAFRVWHANPDHRTSSHALIPEGLELDPDGTEVVIADRIDGATSGSDFGELIHDHSPHLAAFLAQRSSVSIVETDVDGRITRASPSFGAAIGRNTIGEALLELVDPSCRDDLRGRIAATGDPNPGRDPDRQFERALHARTQL